MACSGVALARLWAPRIPGDPAHYLALTGELVALGGLFVIALGVRRRVNRSVTGKGGRQAS